jgi:hypothetical protein
MRSVEIRGLINRESLFVTVVTEVLTRGFAHRF